MLRSLSRAALLLAASAASVAAQTPLRLTLAGGTARLDEPARSPHAVATSDSTWALDVDLDVPGSSLVAVAMGGETLVRNLWGQSYRDERRLRSGDRTRRLVVRSRRLSVRTAAGAPVDAEAWAGQNVWGSPSPTADRLFGQTVDRLLFTVPAGQDGPLRLHAEGGTPDSTAIEIFAAPVTPATQFRGLVPLTSGLVLQPDGAAGRRSAVALALDATAGQPVLLTGDAWWLGTVRLAPLGGGADARPFRLAARPEGKAWALVPASSGPHVLLLDADAVLPADSVEVMLIGATGVRPADAATAERLDARHVAERLAGTGCGPMTADLAAGTVGGVPVGAAGDEAASALSCRRDAGYEYGLRFEGSVLTRSREGAWEVNAETVARVLPADVRGLRLREANAQLRRVGRRVTDRLRATRYGCLELGTADDSDVVEGVVLHAVGCRTIQQADGP